MKPGWSATSAHDGEAEAASLFLGGKLRFEHAHLFLGRDAWAVISNSDADDLEDFVEETVTWIFTFISQAATELVQEIES